MRKREGNYTHFDGTSEIVLVTQCYFILECLQINLHKLENLDVNDSNYEQNVLP